MRPILQSALAFGAVALVLAAPSAPLQAAPGSLGRPGPAGAVQSRSGPEAIPVHDRWGHRHRRHGRHYGYPRHRPNRHRPYRHRPNRHYPYWGYLYWGFPHPCVVAGPWPRGHWRHHHHRRTRGHRHPVPRHRHVRCRGGFTVVLPLPYPPRHYR